MLKVLLALAVVFFILVFSEYLWRQKKWRGERNRKFVHILVGSFIAFWPWFMSFRTIQFISVAFLLVVFLSKTLHTFHALSRVSRRTYGEIFFAITIGVCATITTSKVLFMIGILHLALADGLAAVVGTLYGKKWGYKVLGQKKTVIGSMTFWLVSVWILGVGLLLTESLTLAHHYVLILVFVPPLLTLIENCSPWGLDNIFVPLSVIALLGALQ